MFKKKTISEDKKDLGPHTHITLKFTQFWPDIQAENRKEKPNNGEHGLQWYKSSSVKLPGKEMKYRNGESLLYYCIKRGIFLPFLTVLRVFKIRFFSSLNGLSPFVSFFDYINVHYYPFTLSLSHIQWSHSLLYTRSIVETVQVYAQQCVYTVSLW